MKKLPIAVLASLGLAGVSGCDGIGPCLSIEQTDDFDTETETESDTESESASARDALRDRVLDRNTLPDDVAERLRRHT